MIEDNRKKFIKFCKHNIKKTNIPPPKVIIKRKTLLHQNCIIHSFIKTRQLSLLLFLCPPTDEIRTILHFLLKVNYSS